MLLPAAMKLLGEWNWYLPRWLEWLPRFEHEHAPEDEQSQPERAPDRGRRSDQSPAFESD